MPTISFPRRYVVVLDELAARVLDTHKHDDTHTVARDLLAGFFDICMRSGLDGVLHELAETLPAFDITDRQGLFEHPSLGPAFVTAVAAQNLDGGGPRNTKPRLLTESLLTTLSLVVVDESERTITLGDDVRAAVVAALAGAVEVELAVPRIRETVIAMARAACDPQFHGAFDRLAEHLDERGMKILKQPKVPLHAVHAVQQALSDARHALLDRVARAAIDRAKDVIARADADAAARIDQPISYQLTPRDAAVIRAGEPRVPRQPIAVAQSLLESLTELAQLAWRAAERPVRAYSASQTFTVGELVEHPKFGRGSVTACSVQRIDVEFADGLHTLVHVGKRG